MAVTSAEAIGLAPFPPFLVTGLVEGGFAMGNYLRNPRSIKMINQPRVFVWLIIATFGCLSQVGSGPVGGEFGSTPVGGEEA